MKQPSSALVPVIAGFSVMLLLLLAVTAIGVTHIRLLSNQLTAIVAERNQKSEYAATMRGLHEARFQSMLLASSMDDVFARDAEIMRFGEMAREFIQVRDQFLALPLDSAERALWEDLRGEVRQVEILAFQVFEMLQSNQLPQAHKFIKQVLSPHQERMMRGWLEMLEQQRAKNHAALAQANAARDRAQRLAIGLAIAAMIVGALIAVFVVRLSRRLEKDLFEEKERAQITLHAIGDAVLRIDAQQLTCYLNPVAEHLVGFSSREAAGRPIKDVLKLFDKENQREITHRISQDALRGAPCSLPPGTGLFSAQGMEFEVEGVCSPIHTPEGETIGAVLVLRDVTETREMQRKIQWQANHDALTGLTNRRAFEERVTRTLGSKRAAEFPLSILFIDLDRFKQVNDSAGHAAGDELLRQLGRLMYTRVREGDLLGRLGGDEFGVMLTTCPPENAEKIAHQIKDAICNFSFRWEEAVYQVGASIGVVHVSAHTSCLDDCLAAADAACYQAKQNGRNSIVVYGQ
jgi:diguanylate cyclase (GGDEF)-like protein/PAS domain S-box-containing protein